MADYIQRLHDDLAEQFKDMPTIEALNRAIGRQLNEVRQYFEDLRDKRGIDTAVGKQLDGVGDIVVLSRLEAGELACINESAFVLDDEDYRAYLKFKVLKNTNACTYYDLIKGLAMLWNMSPIYYHEDPAFPATIILTMPAMRPGGGLIEVGKVPTIRPAGVQVQFQYLIRVVVETIARWTIATHTVPLCNQILCGQYPRLGTLGEFVYVETNAGFEEIISLVNSTLTGTIVVGGRAYSSTTGEVITTDVQITVDSDFSVRDVSVAGKTITGTVPIRAVNGTVLRRSVEADGSITTGFAALTLAGTATVGGGEAPPAEQVALAASADAGVKVHIAAATIKRCGTVSCGK